MLAVALAPQPQQAARRLLQVMERLLQLHNYNSLMCLASGMQRVAALLGVKQREKLEALALLVSPAHNYRCFREHLASLKGDQEAVKNRGLVAKKLTGPQMIEGRKRAAEFVPAKSK